jgi:CMP-N-acetylneuraminic acid synthetase
MTTVDPTAPFPGLFKDLSAPPDLEEATMKAVVPAKASSKRVPNKNFRPFVKNKSLFDITVERLLRILPPEDIYLSCEDESKQRLAEQYKINFMLRDRRLAENTTPWGEVMQTVCLQVPGDDDVMWTQVCDPLFDEHQRCVEAWSQIRDRHDSLTVVHPRRGYLLDQNFRPLGFGFGPWHVPSQQLPANYQLGFTLSILTRESISRVGYPVGAKPYWYIASENMIDIDTELDFRVARILFSHEFVAPERDSA